MEVVGPMTADTLVDRLDRATAAISAASADVLRSVAEADHRGLWRRDGATSMTSWLAARYGLAWGTAREWVRVAHALRGLPRIARAYADARLSWDQLRPLTRFATPQTDAAWSQRAPDVRPAALWREARRHERRRAREAEEDHRTRYLSLHWDTERPVLWLEGMLPAEQGATLEAALERGAERVTADPDAADPGGARLADALVELAAGDQPQPATVVIHAGADVLVRDEPVTGPWLAETEGGHRLAAETVRRLACDGRIEWVLESEGRPVGIGRRGRQVPQAIHRILRHRDGGACRFPGCERRRWLHAHHRLIHEGGWRTSGHPGRDLRFQDPTGRMLHSLRAGARAVMGIRLRA